MTPFIENYLLALGGFLFHFLKMWMSALNRKENFLNKPMYLWIAMNLLASCILVYIGPTLPPELIVMSPLTCVLIGVSSSSTLSGIIKIKQPKDLEVTTTESNFGTTTVTVEKQQTTPKP